MAKVDQIRNKAQELFQRGDYAKAVAEYKKVLAEEPGNASVYNFIGDAFVKLNSIDDAVGNYLEAVKGYGTDALYNNAIAVCKKILRLRKDDPEIYKTLGELYIHQGLVNEAITNLLEYAERMMKESRQDLAFPVYNQIVELNPQNLNIRSKLAEMYLAQKRIPEAVNEFGLLAQAYRDQGRQIEAEVLEARIRSMRGEPAAPAAAPSIEIKPARVIEEILQQRQESPPEMTPPSYQPQAAPPPEIVLEREQSTAEPQMEAKQDWATNIELGDLLVEIGSTQEALDQYHSAASGFLGDGNVERAVEVYKKIADIQPLELRSRQKLVEISLQSSQDGDIIEAYLGLAECLRRRELKEQAAAVYQKVLEMDPVNELALENLSLLLPELPEGSVEMPGMEIHPEPASFVEPQPEIAPEIQPAQPEWGEPQPGPEEPQSFIVQAPEEEPAAHAEPVPAGESASDQSNVHWGRDIVEGGRQSRVKFSVADEPQEPAAQEEFLSLSEILAEFKEGVFQQVGKEEYRQHYDLGISYKEMGLLEDAISEFQLASKGEQERLAAFEMLGLCFLERGEPKFAIKQFERGIATPGHSEEEYIGLHYYLGTAYEQLGELDKARESYENTYGIDVSFRDVAQKLMALQPAEEPEPEPTPPPRQAPPPASRQIMPQAAQPQAQPAPQQRPPAPPPPQPQYQQPAPRQAPQPQFQQPVQRPAPQPAIQRPQPVPAAARPPVRPPAASQMAVTAESDQAPKPKPIPSKLKKPDKQRISYV